jgi:hypothetical protein
MASPRQIAANRLNARKSTGPRTLAGKRRSRRNALRHGLTAETLIEVFEHPDDYRAFQRRILRAFKPRSTMEQELVGRLVSLLWRLRRATAIETGLIDIHGKIVHEQGTAPAEARHQRGPSSTITSIPTALARLVSSQAEPPSVRNLAETYLRLSNLSGDTWDRLGRYEVMLWRQVAQILFLLGGMRLDALPSASALKR